MNAKERTKILALSECNFGAFRGWEKRYAKAMKWLAMNDREKPLSKKQKWALDVMIYKYRRQLAGNLPDHLMVASRPDKADYGIEENPELVEDLFTGSPREPLLTDPEEIKTSQQQEMF